MGGAMLAANTFSLSLSNWFYPSVCLLSIL